MPPSGNMLEKRAGMKRKMILTTKGSTTGVDRVCLGIVRERSGHVLVNDGVRSLHAVCANNARRETSLRTVDDSREVVVFQVQCAVDSLDVGQSLSDTVC